MNKKLSSIRWCLIWLTPEFIQLVTTNQIKSHFDPAYALELESTCLLCWHTRVSTSGCLCSVLWEQGVVLWCGGDNGVAAEKLSVPPQFGAGLLGWCGLINGERQHRCKVWRSGLVHWSVPQLGDHFACHHILPCSIYYLETTLHLQLEKYEPY